MINVLKRDDTQEPIDYDKIHNILAFAGEGLNISISQVEMNAKIQFYDGIPTADINEMLIKAASDLITAEESDYAILAGRLLMFTVRKMAYGQHEPTSFLKHITGLTERGLYDKDILKDYTADEVNDLESYIDHDKDLAFKFSGAKQLFAKYLLQSRVTGEVFESPQYMYMLIAMCLFSKYPARTRMDYVVRFYKRTSELLISLPTPIMTGVRTPTRQFSSCTLIEAGDSLDSINAASNGIVKYISQRAGVGINGGRIRALGSSIRGGEAKHTGVIPFWKHFQTAVKSCSQGGVRGGAATLFYPFWHMEVESLLVLKNNRGTDETRIRHLDYGVQLNGLMYRRFVEKGNITLFSPDAVPGMYEAFFEDQALFEKLYTEAEANPNIRKATVKATELFSTLMMERAQTARIYIQNVDHCNTHSPFDPTKAPIRQSNLCLEIALPTAPMENILDENGEVALCTLSAINVGLLKGLSVLDDGDLIEELCDLTVRALDALLDYQAYPIKCAETSAKQRRTLGVGVIGYATHLARNGLKYSDGSANQRTHELFESIQYHLLLASNRLAKEQGACEAFGDTTYSQGILPIDTYRKHIDTLAKPVYLQDWEVLRASIVEHGLRNSTLMALMPSETSSQVSNATNGIEPPRGPVVTKGSKDNLSLQVVPEFRALGDKYEYLWDIPNNKGYLELVGIMQKFVDQAISANTNYDPTKFSDGKVSLTAMIRDLLTAYKLGVKTLYYHNTRDGSSDGDTVAAEECDSGGCKI